MKFGLELAVGVAKPATVCVVGSIAPTLLASSSVNQRLPSGPATIENGLEFAVGTLNSRMVDGSRRGSIGSTMGR